MGGLSPPCNNLPSPYSAGAFFVSRTMLVIYARSADGHDQFWTCDGYELRGGDLHVFWQGRLTDVITAAQMPSGAVVFDCIEPDDCDDIEDATDEPEDLSVFAGPRH